MAKPPYELDEFGTPVGMIERLDAAKSKEEKLAVLMDYMDEDEAERFLGRATDNPDGDIPGRQELIALGKKHHEGLI